MTTKQKCEITTNKTVHEYIQECGRGSLSKTLICRMVTDEHGRYWKNILSQITISNELTQPMKETLKQTINNLDINSHANITAKDLVMENIVKKKIGNRIAFIVNMFLKTIEKGIILNSGFEKTDIISCQKNIEKLEEQLSDKLFKLNTELDREISRYNLNDLSDFFLVLFNYIEIVFEITSSIGYGKKSGGIFTPSRIVSKFINWKLTPCIHRAYYFFYDLFKKYGLTVKLLTPDCQNTDTGGKRELKLGQCKAIDLTAPPKIQNLLKPPDGGQESQFGGELNECEKITKTCIEEYPDDNDGYESCTFTRCASLSEQTTCKIGVSLIPSIKEGIRNTRVFCKEVSDERKIEEREIEEEFASKVHSVKEFKNIALQGWNKIINDISHRRDIETDKLASNEQLAVNVENEAKRREEEEKIEMEEERTKTAEKDRERKVKEQAAEEKRNAEAKAAAEEAVRIAEKARKAEEAVRRADEAERIAEEAAAEAREEEVKRKAEEAAAEAKRKAEEAAIEAERKATEFLETQITRFMNSSELSDLIDVKIIKTSNSNIDTRYKEDFKLIKKYKDYIDEINSNLEKLKELLTPTDLSLDILYNEFSDDHEHICVPIEDETKMRAFDSISEDISSLLGKIADLKDRTESHTTIVINDEQRKKISKVIKDALINLNFNLTLIEANTLYKDDVEKLCKDYQCYIDCKDNSPTIHSKTFADAVVHGINKDINESQIDNSIANHIFNGEKPALTRIVNEIQIDNHISEEVQHLLKSVLVIGIPPTKWDGINRNDNPRTPYFESKSYWQRPISNSDKTSVMWETWPLIPNLIFNIKKVGIKPKIITIENQLENMKVIKESSGTEDSIQLKIKNLLPLLRNIVSNKLLSESDPESERYRVDIRKISPHKQHEIKSEINKVLKRPNTTEHDSIWEYIFHRTSGVLVNLYKEKRQSPQWVKYVPSPHDVAKACLYYNNKFVKTCNEKTKGTTTESAGIPLVHCKNESTKGLNVSTPKWGSEAHMQSVGRDSSEDSSKDYCKDIDETTDIVYQETIEDSYFSINVALSAVHKIAEAFKITEFTTKLATLSVEINILLYNFYLHEKKEYTETVQVDFIAKIVSLLIDLIEDAISIFKFLDKNMKKSDVQPEGGFWGAVTAVAKIAVSTVSSIAGVDTEEIRENVRIIVEPIYKITNIYCKPYGINVPLLDELEKLTVITE